jgi:hypothetical protein
VEGRGLGCWENVSRSGLDIWMEKGLYWWGLGNMGNMGIDEGVNGVVVFLCGMVHVSIHGKDLDNGIFPVYALTLYPLLYLLGVVYVAGAGGHAFLLYAHVIIVK